jgi:hypothetical protein
MRAGVSKPLASSGDWDAQTLPQVMCDPWNGKDGAAEVASWKERIGGMAGIVGGLAWRLYTVCERKGWAEEAGYIGSLGVAVAATALPELFQ